MVNNGFYSGFGVPYIGLINVSKSGYKPERSDTGEYMELIKAWYKCSISLLGGGMPQMNGRDKQQKKLNLKRKKEPVPQVLKQVVNLSCSKCN